MVRASTDRPASSARRRSRSVMPEDPSIAVTAAPPSASANAAAPGPAATSSTLIPGRSSSPAIARRAKEREKGSNPPSYKRT